MSVCINHLSLIIIVTIRTSKSVKVVPRCAILIKKRSYSNSISILEFLIDSFVDPRHKAPSLPPNIMSFHHHLLSRRRHLLVSTRRAFFHQRGSVCSFHTNNNNTIGNVFWKNNVDRRRCLSFQQLQHLQQFQHQHQHQHQHQYQHQQTRNMNSWQGHGTDLLGDSLDHNDGVPKIVLHGHSETGFDVINMIKNLDPSDENLRQTGGIVHCAGSILAFPGACFLWNVRRPEELTAESLAPVLLYRPELEYLFLGCSKGTIPHELIQSIRKELRTVHPNLVVEPLDITNTMGTFNVLNGEDRRVAAGLILIPEDDDDEE